MTNFYQDSEDDDPWDAYAASIGANRWTEWQYDSPREAVTTVAGIASAARAQSQPHSGLGIASLLLSCLAGVGILLSIGMAVVLSAMQPAIAEDDPRMIIAGLGILGGVALAGVAGVLGIVGLFRTDRNRMFAILGCILSGMLILGTGGLLIIGLVYG